MEKNDVAFSPILKDPTLWPEFENSSRQKTLGHGNPDFLFGVATSTYQDSGEKHCPHSQWSAWENKNLPEDERSDTSVNLFYLYKTDPQQVIQRIQQLSANTYRFSIEWSHIEPKRGQFDRDHLQTYVDFCKLLQDHQIKPLITLHHFSEPVWFHQMGSFEKEENIDLFVGFCELVCKELLQEYKGRPLVAHFCTINEPGVEAYNRYLLGYFPPNLAFRFTRGAKFLYHMLVAHTKVYKMCKSLAGSSSVMVGITHQYLNFYAENILMQPLAYVFNKYQKAVLHFFKTGVFECHIPFFSFRKQMADKPQVDFVGVQFYARVFLGIKGVLSKGKPITTMWGVYEDPEGLYQAILDIYASFKSPILVTESGISTNSDEQRARFLERALQSAAQAEQKIGKENMLGYILWSFTDNFEWFLGWKPRFGAYSFSKEEGISPHYKKGVQPFVEGIKSWKRSLGKL